MVERTLLVKARLGLHARAAAKVVRVAQRFDSQVELRRIDTSVTADAKSILSLLMLAASRGTELHVTVEGTDEEDALNAIDKLFDEGFGEMGQELPG